MAAGEVVVEAGILRIEVDQDQVGFESLAVLLQARVEVSQRDQQPELLLGVARSVQGLPVDLFEGDFQQGHLEFEAERIETKDLIRFLGQVNLFPGPLGCVHLLLFSCLLRGSSPSGKFDGESTWSSDVRKSVHGS